MHILWNFICSNLNFVWWGSVWFIGIFGRASIHFCIASPLPTFIQTMKWVNIVASSDDEMRGATIELSLDAVIPHHAKVCTYAIKLVFPLLSLPTANYALLLYYLPWYCKTTTLPLASHYIFANVLSKYIVLIRDRKNTCWRTVWIEIQIQ